jgi:hypothetical protein
MFDRCTVPVVEGRIAGLHTLTLQSTGTVGTSTHRPATRAGARES